MTVVPPPYTLPVSERSPRTWSQTLHAVLFFVVFNFACLMIHGTQLVFLALLRFLPFVWAAQLYEAGIRYTKGSFGTLLVLMSQWFAPTKIIISFEKEGMGRFSEAEIEDIVVRDDAGRVTLKLPNKYVLISNHQVYTDWWYVWSMMYFMGTHKDVYIVLKKSLKWLPIVGWGMQFFRFIFLARSWASDRLQLASQLSKLGKQAEQHDRPLSLIIYPEGTLVSEVTKPISKKYADKMGIADLDHILLPRSTGLLYSLRSLAPRIPALRLIDVTMVYPGQVALASLALAPKILTADPGVPPMGYGQSYYTLRSIFFDNVPPPAIHVHLRMFRVASEVPIGHVLASDKSDLQGTNPEAVQPADAEREKFDLWLRDLWQDKDRLISKFHEKGSFVEQDNGSKYGTVEIPVELRRKRDILEAFCFCGPAIAGYLWVRLQQTVASTI